MPLYGHELNEEIDPLSAGCGWCVDLEKDFLGAAALRVIAAEGPKRKMTGMVLEGKRIARQGARVFYGGAEVGVVTSGTLSPTLGKSIAMGYVDSALSNVGQSLELEIKEERATATVVALPFYKRQG